MSSPAPRTKEKRFRARTRTEGGEVEDSERGDEERGDEEMEDGDGLGEEEELEGGGAVLSFRFLTFLAVCVFSLLSFLLPTKWG